MDALEKVKSSNSGITLIEVMVGLVIFSMLIGLSSNLVKQGMDTPFVSNHMEKWLKLLDKTNTIVLNLPINEDMQQVSTDNLPG